MMMSGSSTGVCPVNFVVNEAITPNIMPISVPPRATIRNEVAPSKKSVPMRFSLPIVENVSNILYNTFVTIFK